MSTVKRGRKFRNDLTDEQLAVINERINAGVKIARLCTDYNTTYHILMRQLKEYRDRQENVVPEILEDYESGENISGNNVPC